MDFVRSYFGTNEPLTSWTLFSSLFVQIGADHLYRSNFLQNPYFNKRAGLYIRTEFSEKSFLKTKKRSSKMWSYANQNKQVLRTYCPNIYCVGKVKYKLIMRMGGDLFELELYHKIIKKCLVLRDLWKTTFEYTYIAEILLITCHSKFKICPRKS